jgi:hypothetical protein
MLQLNDHPSGTIVLDDDELDSVNGGSCWNYIIKGTVQIVHFVYWYANNNNGASTGYGFNVCGYTDTRSVQCW